MSVGLIKWKLCLGCGRNFLAVEKQNGDYSDYTSYCPKCRTVRLRKVWGGIVNKWLAKDSKERR